MFNTRWVIGKTIKIVSVTRMEDSSGGTTPHIDFIEFTDGSRLELIGVDSESGDGQIIEPVYVPAKRKKRAV
jgi:hypothetical protein